MKMLDLILLGVIVFGVVLAMRHMRKNKNNCCGDCSQCSGGCFDGKSDCKKEE